MKETIHGWTLHTTLTNTSGWSKDFSVIWPACGWAILNWWLLKRLALVLTLCSVGSEFLILNFCPAMTPKTYGPKKIGRASCRERMEIPEGGGEGERTILI